MSLKQLLLLAVKNSDSFSKWEKEKYKKALEAEKMMGEGEVGEERRYWGLGR